MIKIEKIKTVGLKNEEKNRKFENSIEILFSQSTYSIKSLEMQPFVNLDYSCDGVKVIFTFCEFHTEKKKIISFEMDSMGYISELHPENF